MITYPRVRMFFMLVGIIATLQYGYEALGLGLAALNDLGTWLGDTF